MDGDHYPLTVLLAPGGFGKSTLLRQLSDQFEEAGSRIAWLTCEASDRDAESLIQSLRLALARCDNAFALCRPTISAILATMDDLTRPLVLVIDDFELVDGNEAYTVIEMLVALLPPGHRILLGSRHFDEAQLARFLVDESAIVIDAKALALSEAESHELLGRCCDTTTIRRVREASEGWPMMLQLARIKADQPGGNTTLLENLLRPHSELFGFLAQEIVGTLPLNQAELLTDCSVVEYIDADIAAALTKNDQAHAILAAASQLDPLITAQSEPALTIRLHPVMREYLQQALSRRGSRAIAKLNMRASQHFADKGDIFRAIEHAMKADNPDFAAEVFERIGGPLAMLSHGPANVSSFLSQLPRPLIEGRTGLCGTQIIRSVTLGDSLSAERLYHTFARSLVRDQQIGPINSQEIASLVELSRLVLTDACASITDFLEDRLPLLEMEMRRWADDEPRLLGVFLAFKFFLEARHGSIVEARKTVEEYEEVCDRLAYSSQLPSISPHLGILAFHAGDFKRASWYFSESLAHHWDGFVGREELLVRVGNSLLANMFYEQNQLSDALANIRAIPEVREATFSELILAHDITMARCLALEDEPAKALDHLDRAYGLRKLYGLNAVLPALDCLRVELLARAGDLAGAREHYERCKLASIWEAERERSYWNWGFVDAYLRAAALLFTADNAPEALLALGQDIFAQAEKTSRVLIAQEARIAMANAYMQLENEEAARTCLERSLHVHRTAGIVRPYFDLASNLAPMLEKMRKASTDDETVHHLDRTLALWDETIKSKGLSRLLTPRESDVLGELAKGKPTKLIARSLGVSPETVKHHLKNIFVKLEVENRKDAVSEAYRRAL